MTDQELLVKLRELNYTPDQCYSDWDDKYTTLVDAGIEKPTKIQEWGGEGEGERIGFVLHFPIANIYLRADGYYASYDGSDFSSARWKVVTAQQKTITVYE